MRQARRFVTGGTKNIDGRVVAQGPSTPTDWWLFHQTGLPISLTKHFWMQGFVSVPPRNRLGIRIPSAHSTHSGTQIVNV